LEEERIIMSNTQSTKLLTITPKAAEKIAVFMKEETDKPEFLRVYVQGGGCSGLSYGMSFEKAKEEDDVLIEENGVKIIVDSYSQDYLKGANVDYIESLMGAGFKINNPNVTKSCSCGSSFSTS
jgi:iron-sulfur cluster assembly protein